MEQREDGTTLILTEARAESKEAFSSQSKDTRRFQHTETTVTGAETSADEAANLITEANNITSEHGFEEQVPAPEFGDDGLSAGKLPGKQQHVLIFDIHSNTFVCLPHQLAFAH